MANGTIQPHNAKAAATWSAPGEPYEEISRGIGDAIEHCVYRLAVRSDERVPTRTLAANLPAERRERFRRDMLEFHQRFTTELGVSKPREYLLTIATRN